MNSSQLESSQSTSQDRIDFQRFQGIWNNIKKVKQQSGQSKTYQKESSNRKSIISVKKAIEEQQQKNIQTRLILTQKQLKKAKQNTTLLLKKLSEAEEQIEYLEYELQKQTRQKQDVLDQMEQIKKRLMQKEKQRTSSLQKQTIRGIQSDSQLQKLIKKLEFKDREIDKLNLKVKSLELNLKNQSNQLSLLSQNTKIYQRKMEETERTIFLNQQHLLNAKGTQLLELQEAYNTIERLSLLLRNTDQYRNFTISIENFKDSHFLKNIQQRIKKNQLIQKPSNKKNCSCMTIKIDQNLLWSPTICYKKVLQLKVKYQTLSQQCIEQLLFQLNKVYSAKQQNSLKNLKESYELKLGQLKKKNEIRYDELVARKQIQRLKKQIQVQKYSKNKGNKSSQLGDNIEILKAIGQYEDELKLKEKQILLLKQRIRLMEMENSNYDKILYLQGTLWIIDKVLLEIEGNTEEFQAFEQKFRQRTSEIKEDEEWMNNFKYFFENVTEIQNCLVQKLLMMKQSTVKKMGNQKGQFKQSAFNQ